MKVDNCGCSTTAHKSQRVAIGTKVPRELKVGGAPAIRLIKKNKNGTPSTLQFGELKKTDDERVAEFLAKKKKDLEKNKASKMLDTMKHPDLETLVGSIKYGPVIASQAFPSMAPGTRSNYAIVIEYLPPDPNIEYNMVEYGYIDRRSKDQVNLNVRFVDEEYKGIHQDVYDRVFTRINKVADATATLKLPVDEMGALVALKLVTKKDNPKKGGGVSTYLDYTAVGSGDTQDIRYGYFNLSRSSDIQQVVITYKNALKLDTDAEAEKAPKKKKIEEAAIGTDVGFAADASSRAKATSGTKVGPVERAPKKKKIEVVEAEKSVPRNEISPEDVKPGAKFSWADVVKGEEDDEDDEDEVSGADAASETKVDATLETKADTGVPALTAEDFQVDPEDMKDPKFAALKEEGDELIELLKNPNYPAVDLQNKWHDFCLREGVYFKLYLQYKGDEGDENGEYVLNDPCSGGKLEVRIPYKTGDDGKKRYAGYVDSTYKNAIKAFNERVSELGHNIELITSYVNAFKKLHLIDDNGKFCFMNAARSGKVGVGYDHIAGESKAFTGEWVEIWNKVNKPRKKRK